MKVSDFIALTIDRLPRGYIFTHTDFTTEVNKKEAVIKALNRMASTGKISKLSKGKYYKPKNTVFGALLPPETEIVKDLLEDGGKVTGYLTGYSIYNQLGLTRECSMKCVISLDCNVISDTIFKQYCQLLECYGPVL